MSLLLLLVVKVHTVQFWCKKLTDLDALEMMRTMMHCTVQCTFESNPSLASDPGRPPCPANLDQDIFKSNLRRTQIATGRCTLFFTLL